MAASLLLGYARCASVDQVLAAGQPLEDLFPRPLRRHPANPDRSTAVLRADLLCFHVGNALYTLHEFILGEDAPAVTARCALVRALAATPLDFVAHGNANQGYRLVPTAVARELCDQAEAEQARTEAEYEKTLEALDS